MSVETISASTMDGIAIVGMSGRFPGADSITAFWNNLKQGVESISHFQVDDLEIADGTKVAAREGYVRARAILENVDRFDAEFFGVYPQEAKLMDPQHRVFLECCWEAMEDAGYDPLASSVPVGVFAGCSANSYFLTEVARSPDYLADYAASYQVGHYTAMLGAIPDTLATRVAYKLNLRGPAITILSACSTSLVAVCQACASLLTYQCDAALAGGVSITFPQKRGYFYQAGGMVSPDGHCRSFDADAQGTVFGSGAGSVLLKRLSDAKADGDHIYAVIKGFAVNNDGSGKVGFTAPSIEGQAQVIAAAQAMAMATAESISYIEAHGTATPLGDPIEVAALTQVFRQETTRCGFCALGTAKTNVGHLDAAAGITGLIKTALSLKHHELPPVLHFKEPNPKLNLKSSPFYVNAELREWKSVGETPNRAGVSSFGVGGTNAHIVLEEALIDARDSGTTREHLLLLSARSENALSELAIRLARFLEHQTALRLSDVAFTLACGRHHFPYRRSVACRDLESAVNALRRKSPATCLSIMTAHDEPKICFLFPGQGSQYAGMGRELYDHEVIFRETVDECACIIKAFTGSDIRQIIFASHLEADNSLDQTMNAQPALFTIEYALAKLWLFWGIKPYAMAGHSVGEFVAACVAGVLSLRDALFLISERARLMQAAPIGGMLAVHLSEQDVRPFLPKSVCLAASNAPGLTVVAGPHECLTAFKELLSSKRIATRTLRTSHAFHSSMMDCVIEPFGRIVKSVRFSAPSIPFVSCITGRWITDDEVADASYWTNHLRRTVRFNEVCKTLMDGERSILLEVGPGTTLQTLARQQASADSLQNRLVSSLSVSTSTTEYSSLLQAVSFLWHAGVDFSKSKYFTAGQRIRVSLPTYPFERSSYWVDRSEGGVSTGNEQTPVTDTKTKRMKDLQRSVCVLVSDLSGLPESELAVGATFLELGLDSLFLTQLARACQSRFAVTIAFSQLLGELGSISALAEFLHVALPVDIGSQVLAVTKPDSPILDRAHTPVASNALATHGGSSLELLMKAQLDALSELTSRQLELLRSGVLKGLDNREPELTLKGSIPPVVTAQQEVKAFGPHKPPERTALEILSPVQQTYLDSFVQRYTAKTAKSKALTAKYRKVLADPRVASGFRLRWKELVYPIATNRSQGANIWDIDDNEYVDLLNGFGPIMLGHLPPFVRKAAQQQLDRGIEIGPQTSLAGEVAELLCDITGMERATFCNTGSEAVMAAIRLARCVTGRSKVVFFSGDYHGNFDEVLLKRGLSAGDGIPLPIAPGIPSEAGNNMVVLDYGSAESRDYVRTHANELAAVLVEPVQSRHPGLRPADFLREIRTITAASGAALIFDEIVTGFRLHLGGAQAYYGIRADLANYGKVLGGGFPIGAVAGSSRFMDALDGGDWSYGDDSFPKVGVTFFAGTFVRHPLALAAAKAVLLHLKEQGPELQEELTARTQSLVDRLNGAFERYRLPSRIECAGSVFYFCFPASFKFGSLLYYHLRERGVYIQEGFPCFLTTSHTDENVKTIIESFEGSLKEMRNGGVLPDSASPGAESPQPLFNERQVHEAPITEPQLEVLVSAKLSEDANRSYNESFLLYLTGQLDHAALSAALTELVKRHDSLRSTFDLDSKTIRFKADANVQTQNIDLSQSPEGEWSLTSIVDADAQTPFDLEQGPVIRLRIIKLSDTRSVVLFTAHHIVCDGWSTSILVQELGELYSALRVDRNHGLSVPLSFGQYSLALRRDQENQESDATEKYWLRKFQQLPPLLDLPVDRPRPAVKSFAGGTVRRVLSPVFLKAMKELGASQGCTLFMTLLSGFQVLLSRISGLNQISVGIPAAAQSLLEGQVLVGHCVNLLPICASLDPRQSFSTTQKACKAEVLEAYKNQKYTFGTLVRKLRIPRDPSRLPLIEVQFNLERLSTRVGFDGLEVEVDTCPKKFVNFDLFLNVLESPNGLVLDCDYNKAIFDQATINRWLVCYETLLASAANNPGQAIAELPLIGQEDIEHLLRLNPQPSVYQSNRPIQELIADQVRLQPNETALVFRDQKITYAELHQRAELLAAFLITKGFNRTRPVAILMERSIEMVVGLLAILKAGGVYLPLDPSHPRDRLEMILEEADPEHILTSDLCAKSVCKIQAQVTRLDSDWKAIATENLDCRWPDVGSQDLAYVIYTSGSTGRPKGVEISHRAVVNFLCSMKATPGFLKTDTLLAVTTLSFDIAALELLLPLVTGARIVIASQEDTIDGALLSRLIKKHNVSVMQATPSTWRLLLEADWKPGKGLKMLCGGEALPRGLADKLLAGGGELWNMYGPTETTIWSSVTQVHESTQPVRIGRPIANTQFYVLDQDRQLQPLGVPGELFIAGDGVARGYFKRPDLTAERFVPNPFSSDRRSVMYRTGDLVKLLPNGELEFLGRLDNQIKLRGFRIELGEIESALLKCRDISEVVVGVHENSGTKHLVAYFSAERPVHDSHLKEVAAAALPAYMIPAFFIRVTKMPRTANGKIDRKALPSPNMTGKREFVSPRNDLESKLAEICCEVLSLKSISLDDNLFELGADSIQIFRIVARARQAGLLVSAQQILKSPRIRDLSNDNSILHASKHELASFTIKRVPREMYRVTANSLRGLMG